MLTTSHPLRHRPVATAVKVMHILFALRNTTSFSSPLAIGVRRESMPFDIQLRYRLQRSLGDPPGMLSHSVTVVSSIVVVTVIARTTTATVASFIELVLHLLIRC